MQQLIAARTTVIMTIFLALTLGVIHGLAQAEQPRADRQETELTKVDLFSRPNWDSTSLRICGLQLGLSRTKAKLAVEGEGMQLIQSDPQSQPLPCSDARDCYVSDISNPWDYENLTVHFGKADEISELTINGRPPELRGDLIRRFKGETYRFFNGGYSNELRLKLFGPETNREQVSGRWGDELTDTEYEYPVRGISITSSPRGFRDQRPELAGVRFYTPRTARDR